LAVQFGYSFTPSHEPPVGLELLEDEEDEFEELELDEDDSVTAGSSPPICSTKATTSASSFALSETPLCA